MKNKKQAFLVQLYDDIILDKSHNLLIDTEMLQNNVEVIE